MIYRPVCRLHKGALLLSLHRPSTAGTRVALIGGTTPIYVADMDQAVFVLMRDLSPTWDEASRLQVGSNEYAQLNEGLEAFYAENGGDPDEWGMLIDSLGLKNPAP